jgi:hypothetical protein
VRMLRPARRDDIGNIPDMLVVQPGDDSLQPGPNFSSQLKCLAGCGIPGPHVAGTSGQRRSLRVSPTGVCSTAPTGRGILPSWSCEFDSRHPLQNIAPSQLTFAVPKLFEHPDDKNNQAGHLSFMIISARCTEVPCQVALFELEIRLC